PHHWRRGCCCRQDGPFQDHRQVWRADLCRRCGFHWRRGQATVWQADRRLMLETIASSGFGFWGIAGLIVVIDSVVLLTPGEFVFAFNRDGKPVVRAAATPYLVRNKDLSFASLTLFARPFFVSCVSVPDVPDDELAALARQARQHRSIY